MRLAEPVALLGFDCLRSLFGEQWRQLVAHRGEVKLDLFHEVARLGRVRVLLVVPAIALLLSGGFWVGRVVGLLGDFHRIADHGRNDPEFEVHTIV